MTSIISDNVAGQTADAHACTSPDFDVHVLGVIRHAQTVSKGYILSWD